MDKIEQGLGARQGPSQDRQQAVEINGGQIGGTNEEVSETHR
jgi:hypothetical protein